MEISKLGANYQLQDAMSKRNPGELGKDEFLKLLVEQLKAQDPLNPMDNNEFIAQSAQFSQLEQSTQLNTTLSGFLTKQESMFNYMLSSQNALQATNFIGKEITAYSKNSESGELEKVEGKVDRIVFTDLGPKLMVGDKAIGLDEIAEFTE